MSASEEACSQQEEISLRTETIEIELTSKAVRRLRALTATGLYGFNVEDTAAEMIYTTLRQRNPLP